MTYKEKLRDPRWQKCRLKILDRDNFKCRVCGDDKTELHVHHDEYLPNVEPWDANPEKLLSLCKECHYIVTFISEDHMNRVANMVIKVLRANNKLRS